MKTSMSPSSVFVVAVAALLFGPASASSQVPSQHLKIHNRTSESVTVRVLHSDGSLQKQETIQAGDTHRFIFDWCYECCGHSKHRLFEVKTGSTLRATGELTMETGLISMESASDCIGRNEMKVTDKNASDSFTFSTDYENQHRTAILTVSAGSF